MKVTLKDIAGRAGVSICTVSKVLAGRADEDPISERTQQKVKRLAREMDYRPNAAARSIRTQRTNLIGVLIRNDPGHPLHYAMAYEILLGIDATLSEAGYGMTLVRIEDVRHLRDQSRAFREHTLDGMIVMDTLPDEVFRRVEAAVPKCVWVESSVWRDHNCLRRDEASVGRGVVEQVVAHGYRELVHVGGALAPDPLLHYCFAERQAALSQAAAQRGLALSVVERFALDAPEARKRLLHPSAALLTSGGWDAQRIARSASEDGKVPGRDFGLVAMDEEESVRVSWPELSRFAFDRYALGGEAARMLLDLVARGHKQRPSRRFEAPWVEGQTLGSK